MNEPGEYSFIRYLQAKRTVDDRALNQRVWQHLVTDLGELPREDPLRVIEVGAGIGTMLQRMVEWGLDRDMDYTALDSDPSVLSWAAKGLPTWAGNRGWRTEQPQAGSLILEGQHQRVRVEFLPEDISNIPENSREMWDLLVAHAFLDLVDLETALKILLSLLRPDGFFYLTLVFDGATIFRPIVDPTFEALVESSYHRTMEGGGSRRQPQGHSQTGRMLLEALLEGNASISAAGSSDWVIHPPYEGDEAYFLYHILHIMEGALKSCPDLDQNRFEQWIGVRRRQIEKEQLIYIAHQLDLLGRPHG
ncbi:MAG: methyltransferase domain-containing protein [Proteobacteria bacterium]|nr:methyltransferase domain-containing protein [Pseudomonadota bacterium]